MLLEDGSACILHRLDGDAGGVSLAPLPAAVRRVGLDELERGYAGCMVYLRPLVRLDAQPDPIHSRRSGHWFRSVLRDYCALYRDIFLFAVLINLFALAAPLFMRVVYNRVIPNDA